MLTASARNADVNRAYELGVTSYLRKTANQAEFGQAVRVILKYWLELNVTAELAARENPGNTAAEGNFGRVR